MNDSPTLFNWFAAVVVVVLFGGSALLLWERLTRRRWVSVPSIMPQDVPGPDGDVLQ